MENIKLQKITALAETALVNNLLHVLKTSFLAAFGHNYPQADIDHYIQNSLTLAALQAELADPKSHFFGLWQDRQLVGMVKQVLPGGKFLPPSIKPQSPAYLERLYLLPSHQGLGLADVAMTHAVHYAKRLHQADYIYLTAWEHNLRALRFYENHGFRVLSRIQYPVGNTLDNEYVMGKTL